MSPESSKFGFFSCLVGIMGCRLRNHPQSLAASDFGLLEMLPTPGSMILPLAPAHAVSGCLDPSPAPCQAAPLVSYSAGTASCAPALQTPGVAFPLFDLEVVRTPASLSTKDLVLF